MQIHRCQDDRDVTAVTADLIADRLGRAIAGRGRAVLALSGGGTPKPLYRRLATVQIDWRAVHVVQVDERFAPADSADRNWVAIRRDLVDPTGATGHPMPTTGVVSDDLAADYAAVLADLGPLDMTHLGIGEDGHTASLVPGDPVLRATADVAVTEMYQDRHRMTLSAPMINRSQTILWQVVGRSKSPALVRMLAGDTAVPAHLIRQDDDVHLILDGPAATAVDKG